MSVEVKVVLQKGPLTFSIATSRETEDDAIHWLTVVDTRLSRLFGVDPDKHPEPPQQSIAPSHAQPPPRAGNGGEIVPIKFDAKYGEKPCAKCKTMIKQGWRCGYRKSDHAYFCTNCWKP